MEETKNKDNNRKVLILSILGIIVLIIAVVGISFAMYTFSGTGTKENVIKTGTVNLTFDDEGGNNIVVDNQYPMTDAKGIQSSENQKKFAITATWSGNTEMTINYSIGIDESSIVEGNTLKKGNIKIALVDESGNIFVGTQQQKESSQGEYELTGGKLISELESQSDSLLSKYFLANGVITHSGEKKSYTLYAWVADNYNLPTGEGNVDSTLDGNIVKTDDDNKTKQEKTTNSETFKFRLKIQAEQKFSN